ncbi:MAG: hypothetical protein ACRDWI_09010 [Jiangellaceae bacterium]
MTASPSIDSAQFLHEHLSQASPDLMRELLARFRSRRAGLNGRGGSKFSELVDSEASLLLEVCA